MDRYMNIELLEFRRLFAVTPTFGAPTGFIVGKSPIAVIAVDLNGDKSLDFVTADAQGTLTVRRGRGNGTFRPATTIGVAGSATDVIAADFNKDGKLDLAVAASGANLVQVFLGSGDGGTFNLSATLAGGDMSSDPAVSYGTGAKLAAGDFNGDGFLDLVVTNPKAVKLVSFPGQGNGQFGAGTTTTPKGYHLNGVVAGDFNRDGKTDLATAQYSSINILFGTAGGTFTSAQLFGDDGTGQSTGVGLSDCHDIVADDFNGDTYLDLADVDGDLDGGDVFLGSASGAFSFGSSFGTGYNTVGIDRGPNSLVAADFNGDHLPDLAVTNLTEGTRAVIVNNGSAQWSTIEMPSVFDDFYQQPRSKFPVNDVAAGDFNNDGKIDLLFAEGSGSRNVDLQLNTTTGNAVYRPSISSFTATSNAPAGTITLSAKASETNGTITSVDFYAYDYLGTGTLSGGVWTLTIPAAGFGAGSEFYAVANDANQVSNYTSITLDTPATGPSVVVPANKGVVGQMITVDAFVTDPGRTVNGVKFYLETDGTAGLNLAADKFLGDGNMDSPVSAVLMFNTTGYAPGTLTIYAVATDAANATAQSSGSFELWAKTTRINSFTATPSSLPVGGTVQLSATAEAIYGQYGPAPTVQFYRESNNSPGLQAGPDTLLGSGTLINGVWMLNTDTAGLPAGNCTYYVVAMDGYNNAPSDPSSTMVTLTANGVTKPNAPVGLSAVAQAGPQIALHWADAAGNETGFEVQRATTFDFSNATTFTINQFDVVDYVDATVAKSTYYYYRVRCFNAAGYSGYSNSVKIKSLATGGGTPQNGLATPTSFTAKAMAGGTSLLLNWVDNALGESGYEIQVSTKFDFSTLTQDVTVSTPNLTSYAVNGLSKSTWYYVRVRAVTTPATLDSAWTGSIKLKTLSA